MDQTLPWAESPIDLPDEAPAATGALETTAPMQRGTSGVGWACGAIFTSSLALLTFNSHALANWADQLPVVPITIPLIEMADGWHARADGLGLNDGVNLASQAAATMRRAQWRGPPDDGSVTHSRQSGTGAQR